MSKELMGFYCLLAGIAMIAGWWVAFRNRPYLGFLGAFFLALAAALNLGHRLEMGARTPVLKWGLIASIAAAGVLFVVAFASAVQESRTRFREVREHYRAAADAMVELERMKEEAARRAREKGTEETDAGGPKQT